MANRFPLILDRENRQLEELASGDNLDLTGSNITGVVNINATGSVDAADVKINGVSLSSFGGDYNDLTNRPTKLSDFTNDVGFITSDTDAQNLGLIGTNLSIERGNTINLSSLFVLTLNGTTLEIGSGSSADLTQFVQELSIDGTNLTISDGNTVDLDPLVSQLIPTNISSFVNDAGYLTSSTLDTLDSITDRGAETTNTITVGGLITGSFQLAGTGVSEIIADTDINLLASNRVLVGSTPFRLARIDEATKLSIIAQAGDLIYNSDSNKFQGYTLDSDGLGTPGWVDLH